MLILKPSKYHSLICVSNFIHPLPIRKDFYVDIFKGFPEDILWVKITYKWRKDANLPNASKNACNIFWFVLILLVADSRQ